MASEDDAAVAAPKTLRIIHHLHYIPPYGEGAFSVERLQRGLFGSRWVKVLCYGSRDRCDRIVANGGKLTRVVGPRP